MKSKKSAVVSILALIILVFIIGFIYFCDSKPKIAPITISGNDISGNDIKNTENDISDNNISPEHETTKIPEKISMPDVTDMDIDTAARTLNQNFILFEIQWEYNEDAEPVTVINQSIEPGTEVKCFSEWVTITVNSKEENEQEENLVTMPSVVGYTIDEAISTISYYDLKLKEIKNTNVNNDSVPIGCISEQYPESGMEVEPGTEVTLEIFIGKEES